MGPYTNIIIGILWFGLGWLVGFVTAGHTICVRVEKKKEEEGNAPGPAVE
jgi:hypothetical protein